MTFTFTDETIEWRGPAPFLFIPTPDEVTEAIKSVAREMSYGWGCIPVTATIGQTTFTTSLFPRDGTYLVPIKVVVQIAEAVTVGDTITVRLELSSNS